MFLLYHTIHLHSQSQGTFPCVVYSSTSCKTLRAPQSPTTVRPTVLLIPPPIMMFYLPHNSNPYSARSQQGKVAELKLELNSGGGKKDKNFLTKRIALKKIVANMTMSNNDMVALFPDIVGCMGIQNLEIKKMYVEVFMEIDGKKYRLLTHMQVLLVSG